MAWNDERPMSPHLQVYRLPLSAYLSVLHRGTGVILFFGLIIMVWTLLMASLGEERWLVVAVFWQGIWGKTLLLGVSFSLLYHLGNGISHLIWDTGYGMGYEQSIRSGKWLIILVGFFTLLVWSIILFEWA